MRRVAITPTCHGSGWEMRGNAQKNKRCAREAVSSSRLSAHRAHMGDECWGSILPSAADDHAHVK